MRLQLTRVAASCALALACALLVPAFARAQQESSVRVRSSVYQDDDATFIHTHVIAAKAAITDEVAVDAHGLIDVVSTASVDVVSAATKRWTETRKEAEGGLGYNNGNTSVNGTYIYSRENDWWSHTVNLGFTQDLLVHNLTLGASAGIVDNHVGRSHDSTFAERMRVINAGVSAVIVGSPDDLWSVAYNLSKVDGYQASPYRYARFRDLSSPDQILFSGGSSGEPGERMPETRARHAVTVRWNRSLFEDTSLRSHVRLYRDDWGVTSITGGTEYVVGYDPLELAFSARGYAQSHADFYKDVYPREMRYMTSD
ncbi:MAG TPA: DUF3570 domain-containing protein, partial [Polyangiales bacterium]|nr:DUF3570 domain-containing protein [Polyangiales bacterium]